VRYIGKYWLTNLQCPTLGLEGFNDWDVIGLASSASSAGKLSWLAACRSEHEQSIHDMIDWIWVSGERKAQTRTLVGGISML
jgi:hypothetical protein